MRRFFVIEDYTACAIWSELTMTELLKLPSKPQGWDRPENTLPEGDWELAYGIHQMTIDGAYQKAGIPKPEFEDLPTLFCVDGDKVIRRDKVMTAEAALEFIRENL